MWAGLIFMDETNFKSISEQTFYKSLQCFIFLSGVNRMRFITIHLYFNVFD